MSSLVYDSVCLFKFSSSLAGEVQTSTKEHKDLVLDVDVGVREESGTRGVYREAGA